MSHGISLHDPITGWDIPTVLEDNLVARDDLLASCENNPELQQEILELCKQSCLFWICFFCWAYVIKKVGPDGKPIRRGEFEQHVPFILWPVQVAALDDLLYCIDNGEDAIENKSRDMGASTIDVAVATWYLRFHRDSHMIVTGRVEDDVDKEGDPKSLFYKIDYIIKNVPEWMLPRDGAGEPIPLTEFQRGGSHRRYMFIENPELTCSILGQASTEHVGRAGRTLFVLFDEMSSQEHAAGGWMSAADTTDCRIGNSTPMGAGTEYTRQYMQGVATGNPRVVDLMYFNHPDKGQGREWRIDEDGAITGTAGRGFWWTPWFEGQLPRRSKIDLAQNVLADHISSGDTFFNTMIVTRHIQQHAKEPVRCDMVPVDGNWRFEPAHNGCWFIWCKLDDRGRPPLDENYVAFADLSYGKGSSNSACAFMAYSTGRIVAELVTPFMTPHDFADEVCAAGKNLFDGSVDEAYLGYELNGPGESWYQDLQRNNYYYVYRAKPLGKRTSSPTDLYGWRSGPREKKILLGGLDRAMAHGEIIIPSKPGLLEMLTYVFYNNGSVGPGHLRDETTGAKQAHGDRVITYAGCVFMRAEGWPYEPEPEDRFPPDSYGRLFGHQQIIDSWKDGPPDPPRPTCNRDWLRLQQQQR